MTTDFLRPCQFPHDNTVDVIVSSAESSIGFTYLSYIYVKEVNLVSSLKPENVHFIPLIQRVISDLPFVQRPRTFDLILQYLISVHVL